MPLIRVWCFFPGRVRLDLYQKGGDSLAGRYLLFYLWPFTVAELSRGSRSVADFLSDPLAITMENSETLAATWEKLETMSGFPEPFLNGRPAAYRRWSTWKTWSPSNCGAP